MFSKIYLIILFLIINILSFADAHILVYHRFNDTRYQTSNIKTEKLRKDFQYLKDNGFKVVELEKIIEKIEKKEEIPDTWVALTIDDAYETFYTNGLPVFKEFGYPFTLFVNTQAVNDAYGDFLSWEQIAEVSKYGTIGSHSHSHPHSTNISKEELTDDLNQNIKIFKKKYNNKVELYTHPYSEYNAEVLETVKEFNYRAIFNQTSGAVSHKSNIYDINRIAIGNDDNLEYWLKIKYLDAKWEKIEVNNNILNSLKIKVDKNIDKVELYISGYGWKWYNVSNGYLEAEFDTNLKFNINRIIIKTRRNKWSSYTYVKII